MTFTEKPFFSLAPDCEISVVRVGASAVLLHCAVCSADQAIGAVRTGPPEEKNMKSW